MRGLVPWSTVFGFEPLTSRLRIEYITTSYQNKFKSITNWLVKKSNAKSKSNIKHKLFQLFHGYQILENTITGLAFQ